MKSNIVRLIGLLSILILSSCSVGKNISYFQDTTSEGIEIPEPQPIRIKPGDKLAIDVYSKDASIQNLYNLPVYRKRIVQNINENDYSSEYDVDEIYAIASSLYTIDNNGSIAFPLLGLVYVNDLTREEIAAVIKQKIMQEQGVSDIVVIVNYANFFYYVLGEVSKPGRQSVDNDIITIVDAISKAGDLTIYGKRDKIFVKRTIEGKDVTFPVNMLKTEELFKSPAYYIQQNDIIYVEPNKMRRRESTGTLNRWLSVSFWISLANVTLTAIELLTK